MILFVVVKASTQRITKHKLASSLHRSVSFLRFACGAWPSTGRGVVEDHTFIPWEKNVKISFEVFPQNFAPEASKVYSREASKVYSSVSFHHIK